MEVPMETSKDVSVATETLIRQALGDLVHVHAQRARFMVREEERRRSQWFHRLVATAVVAIVFLVFGL